MPLRRQVPSSGSRRLAGNDTEAGIACAFGIRSIANMVMLVGGHNDARQSGPMVAASIGGWARSDAPRAA